MKALIERAWTWLARDGRIEAILAGVILVVVVVIFVRYYEAEPRISESSTIGVGSRR